MVDDCGGCGRGRAAESGAGTRIEHGGVGVGGVGGRNDDGGVSDGVETAVGAAVSAPDDDVDGDEGDDGHGDRH